MSTLYHDNDADLLVRRLPSTVTPNWAVVADPSDFPVVPVHVSLSGTMTWNATQRRHEAVVEGDAITSHLPATDTVTNTPLYAIVVWEGTNVRKVLADIVVKAVRE